MKFLVTLLIVLVTFATADAAKVDIYKAALQNQTFTLKYKVTEFVKRSISKDADVDVLNRTIREAETSGKLDVATGGVIVFDNDNSYIENSHDAYEEYMGFMYRPAQVTGNDYTKQLKHFPTGGKAILRKDGKIQKFSFDLKGTSKIYRSVPNKSREELIKEIVDILNSGKMTKSEYAEYYRNINYYSKHFGEYNYGNTEIYRALQPILPPDRIIAFSNTPTYDFVSSGTLQNGLTYEDFYGEKNNFHSAVRYYFEGDKMIRIATFDYTKVENVIKTYEKHVIDIEEFLTTADENYLQLPANLQDTNKQDKDGGKK